MAALFTVGVALLALYTLSPGHVGLLVLLAAIGLVGVLLGLRSPVLASMYLLVATFFRLAVPSNTLPVDPFLLAFGGVIVSVWVWPPPARERARAVGPLEAAVVLYISWNVGSILAQHPYPAGAPLDPVPFSVARFVIIGIVMPLTMLFVGRRVFDTPRTVRILLWTLLVTAAYSAAVNILQFTGPKSLVWPRYILDNQQWPGRAVGVFNQPVVNGLVLVVGFLVGVLIVSHRSEGSVRRGLAAVVAAASAYGVYLTHTRAAWLSFGAVVVAGVVLAKGFRTPFVLAFLAMAGTVARNWATFTSSDRSAGGVTSQLEIQDRWNTIATSLWAFDQKPLLGWGIGRFPAVNTYHHQQWSPDIPWRRGFGIPSHLDVLGILAELGIVGLVLWLTVLTLLAMALVRAARCLPPAGMYHRPFVVTAILCLIAQITTGLTVDLRFFDFPNIVVMTVVGAAIGLGRNGARTSSPSTASSTTRPAGATAESGPAVA